MFVSIMTSADNT